MQEAGPQDEQTEVGSRAMCALALAAHHVWALAD